MHRLMGNEKWVQPTQVYLLLKHKKLTTSSDFFTRLHQGKVNFYKPRNCRFHFEIRVFNKLYFELHYSLH